MLTTQDSKPEWSFTTEYLLFYTHWNHSCTYKKKTSCTTHSLSEYVWAHPFHLAKCVWDTSTCRRTNSWLHNKLTSPRRHANVHTCVVQFPLDRKKKVWKVQMCVCVCALVDTLVLNTLVCLLSTVDEWIDVKKRLRGETGVLNTPIQTMRRSYTRNC